MLEFFTENLSTILVGAATLAALAAATVSMIKEKKAQGGSCSRGCPGCPNSSVCRREQ